MNQSKPKIVIASVLKPVNDIRMYKKLGLSISDIFDVHIIGYKSDYQENTNCTFYPIYNFSRLSLKRIFAPLLFFKYLLKIKPAKIIVCTHELLFPAVMYRLFFGTKILYDIQENYYLNALYSGNFNQFFKYPFATYIRCKESLFARYVNHFILAENCYQNELPFIKNRFVVLENLALESELKKYIKRNELLVEKDSVTILYSGTIAESYGIFDAINYVKMIHSFDNRVKLKIIGFSADYQLINSINNEIQELKFITIQSDSKPINHEIILQEMNKADFAILSYQPNKSTEKRIPTKLWECFGLTLPVICTKNSVWEKLITDYDAGISVDFLTFSENDWKKIINKSFYQKNKQIPYFEQNSAVLKEISC